MKNVLKAFVLFALVAAIGFSMAACDDDGGGGPGGRPSGGGGGGSSGGGGSGSGGTFTLTGIPSQLNGYYAGVTGGFVSNGILMGGEYNTRSGDWGYTRISNGSVSIPMWVGIHPDFKGYRGNDTANYLGGFVVEIYSSSSGGSVGTLLLDPVTFSNGNATRSWSDGLYFGN